ncbi:MAG: hypothetical protein RR248_00850 [Clostridia bacterium]
MKKRILAIIFVLLLVIPMFVLTGCACEHKWVDGVCSICGEKCEHKWVDSVCSICGKKCAHQYENGVCVICQHQDENYLAKTEFSLQEVTLYGNGGVTPEKYKISFTKSQNMTGVEAYGICYSTSSPKQVKDYLSKINKEQILALEGDNSVYIMTDLSYADGVGNTYNTNQKDIISGKVMTDPGEYRFFCFTLGKDGMLALSIADRTIIKQAYATDLDFTKNGNSLNLTFRSFEDIVSNIVFYSMTNIADVEMRVKLLSANEIKTLISDKKVVEVANAVDSTASIDLNSQKDIYGKAYNAENIYYVYVASLNKEGRVTGIYKSFRLLTPTTLPTVLATIGYGAGNGTIFPNGGACTTTVLASSELTKLKAAIGGRPRVAIIGAASGSEADNFTEFGVQKQLFKQVGMDAVYIPLNPENYKVIGNDDYFSALIGSCHGVHFIGGDQSKISRCIYNDDNTLNKCGQAIYDIVGKGGFATGTSAGANIMSNPTYLNGTSTSTINANSSTNCNIGDCDSGAPNTDVAISTQGLSWSSDLTGYVTLLDSHFDARSRLGRMLVAMRDNNIKLGMGFDEGTGICICRGVGTVYGPNGVFIVDARKATFGSKNDASFTCDNIVIHYLTAGDSIKFDTMTVIPFQKSLVTEPITTTYTTKDIFGSNYSTTQALVTFAFSQLATSSYGIASQTTKLILTRVESTQVYASSSVAMTITGLKDYKKCTIINLVLSIKK